MKQPKGADNFNTFLPDNALKIKPYVAVSVKKEDSSIYGLH